MPTWTPAPLDFPTRWTTLVDPAAPLPEHPRPQLTRPDWLSLNGLWEYVVQDAAASRPDFDPEAVILVPFAPESALSGVGRAPLEAGERLWYRRTFEVPAAWAGRRVVLRFDAVDFEAEVRVNGGLAGSHRGGYTAFAFDVTDLLRGGANELVVAVLDDNTGERGKQFEGFRISGIWQPVWLEPVPERSIEALRITTDAATGSIAVGAEISGPADGLRLAVEAGLAGEIVATGESAADGVVDLAVPGARLWSPEDPVLYDLRVRLVDPAGTVDEVASYAGIRTFSAGVDAEGRPRILLNGVPRFHSAALDHGWWSDGMWTAPTDEALEYDVRVAKAVGFDALRKHVKVESLRWYHHCDRLGVIVWQDMPNGGGESGDAGAMFAPFIGDVLDAEELWRDEGFCRMVRDELWRLEESPGGGRDARGVEDFDRQLTEMIAQLRNSPSIAIWVPFNESWGQFDTVRVTELVRRLDPTRLVDAASGWYDRGGGDFASDHNYALEPLLPHPDRMDGRIPILSEYGGDVWEEPGHGVPDQFGYRTYPTREAYEDGYAAMIARIAALRAQGLAAACYTELGDMPNEQNGVVTADREVLKVDAERSRRLHEALRPEWVGSEAPAG